MDEPYDLLGSLLKSKADEPMIGFAGFVRPDKAGGPGLEGVVKVSAYCRPDGSGYLTLTFIMDRGSDAVEGLGRIAESALRERLGPNFEMLMDIPLNEFAAPSPYLIEEMDFYFHSLKGRETDTLEGSVFPALDELLGLRFEPLQTCKAGSDKGSTALAAEAELRAKTPPKPRSLFARLLGQD